MSYMCFFSCESWHKKRKKIRYNFQKLPVRKFPDCHTNKKQFDIMVYFSRCIQTIETCVIQHWIAFVGISCAENSFQLSQFTCRSLSIIKSSENLIRMLKSIYVIHFMQLHICCDLLFNGCSFPMTSENENNHNNNIENTNPIIYPRIFVHFSSTASSSELCNIIPRTIEPFIISYPPHTHTNIHSFRFTFNLNERDISSCHRE